VPGEATDSDAVLAVQGLSRRFGDHLVVDNFDLRLEAGARVALCGPNGSGKTTILRCLAGTLAPSSGTVSIAGHPAGSIAARAVTGVSLSQERSFYLRLSGRENLLFFARVRDLHRREAERRVRALEEELELEPILPERVDRCSTGMVQQLSLARALLARPALVLLDEPTRSLDTAARKRMWDALGRRTEMAAFIATHDAGDIEQCDSRVDLGGSAHSRR
jgi:ABC-type multidrug transport system ATPase subunit